MLTRLNPASLAQPTQSHRRSNQRSRLSPVDRDQFFACHGSPLGDQVQYLSTDHSRRACRLRQLGHEAGALGRAERQRPRLRSHDPGCQRHHRRRRNGGSLHAERAVASGATAPPVVVIHADIR